MRSIIVQLRFALLLQCIVGVGFAEAQTGAPAGAQAQAASSVGSFGKALSGVFGEYMRFLSEATSSIFSALQGSFQPFAVTIVTLYVIVVGYRLMRGDMGAATKDFALSCFLVVFLTSIVFSPGVYQGYVFDPFVGTVEDISNFFVSKGAGVPISSQGDIFNYMGKTLDSINSINKKLEDNVGFLDSLSFYMSLKVGVAQLILACVYVACIAAYLYLVLQAWFAIFMYMIIGGICVFFASFKATRFVAIAWFRALSHEGLTIIFASLIMGISGNIINLLVTVFETSDPSNGIFTAQYFAVFMACALGFLLLLKAPQLASAISGGSAGSTAGVAAAVGSGAGLGLAAIKKTANATVGRGLGKIGSIGANNLSSGRGGGENSRGGSATSFSDAKGTTPTGGS